MSLRPFCIILLLGLASCVNRFDKAALSTLSEIEGKKFSLSELTWEETMPILSVNMPDAVSAGYDVLLQRMSTQGFQAVLRGNECNSSFTKYDKGTGSYHGDIAVTVYCCGYSVDTGFNHKPSELITADPQFGVFYLTMEYTVSKDGTLTFDTYNQKVEQSGYTQESDHLSCHVDEFTGDSMSIVFPDYLLPDFVSDSFYVGQVKMVFRRND